MTDTTIATTILEQLGGAQFIALTGAKQLVAGENSLTFKLPSNFALAGINVVKITLDPSDTYSIEFGRLRGVQYKVLSTAEDVYNDNLCDVFERATGLYVSLRPRR